MSKTVVLIDRDYILQALGIFNDTRHGNEHFLYGIETAREIVQNAPTIDAVEVVRCEDCQYWQPPTRAEQEDGSTVGHCIAALDGQQTDAYWFCADGTR